MDIQQVYNRFELITMLMQKHVEDIAIDRAYMLADMAIRGEYPDEDFSEEECSLWINYRFLIRQINKTNSKEEL